LSNFYNWKSEKTDLGRNGAFEGNFKGRVTETKGKVLTGADLEGSQKEVLKHRRAKINIIGKVIPVLNSFIHFYSSCI
jgi:flagellar hook protein FlgE